MELCHKKGYTGPRFSRLSAGLFLLRATAQFSIESKKNQSITDLL